MTPPLGRGAGIRVETNGWRDEVFPLTPIRFSSSRSYWRPGKRSATPPPFLRILTWNVDFMAPNARERLLCILAYIRSTVLASPLSCPDPCCILLQEIAFGIFPILLQHDWVRKNFQIVPSSPQHWPAGATYGNVTLISKAIPVLSARSLVFGNSLMGRNALMVDVQLRDRHATRMVVLRIANTHLESLPQGTLARPAQLCAIRTSFRDAGVHAGVAAGDMNAIAPSDAWVHVRAELQDAFRGAEFCSEGFTWGFQPPSRFPPGRLDKILYTYEVRGGGSLQVNDLQTIGAGLRTGRGQWTSDHFGLVTTVSFVTW
ncbi:hypothetical protein AcV5_008637 [Taiwanofungus camphoratus]|nr:hypothetical protein AcV5_008637 [Antrodia cinnamomea]